MRYAPLFIILALLATTQFSCKKGQQTRALMPDTVAQDIQDTSTVIGTWLLTKDNKDTFQIGFQLLPNRQARTIGESGDSLIAWSTKENNTDTTITVVSHNSKTERNDTTSYQMHFHPKSNLLILCNENTSKTYIRIKE